jgi:hypothetical protein
MSDFLHLNLFLIVKWTGTLYEHADAYKENY